MLALAGAVLLSACAMRTAAPTGPREAVAAFVAAVEAGNHVSAHALMSAEYRARVKLEDFRKHLEGLTRSAVEMGKLRETADAGALRTELDLGLGEKLPMVVEEGAWRVDSPPPEAYGQKTPRAALRAFVRALEARRYDVVVRLVPRRLAPQLTAEKMREYWEGERATENRALLGALTASIGAPIVELGDEARMPYGQNAEVRFLREDGLWRIEDPD